MALVERRGVPLCEASVKNESLFERSEFFRLASKHIVGRLGAIALTFFCILFLCQDKKSMSGSGEDSPNEMLKHSDSPTSFLMRNIGKTS